MKPSVPPRGVKVQAQMDWKDGVAKRDSCVQKKKAGDR